jgi:hypothetical protein
VSYVNRISWPVSTIVLGLTLACGSGTGGADSKAAAAKASPSEAPANVAAGPGAGAEGKTPVHDPHGGKIPSMESPKMVSRTAEGKFEVELDASPVRLTHIPYVSNAAVWIEASKLGRITIAAAESDKSVPMLSIVLQGAKLDELTFPSKFKAEALPGGTGPQLRVIWKVNDKRVYKSYLADDLGDAELTLTDYSDGKLSGEMSATVKLANESLGPPIKVTGNFEVALRLSGVKPNRGDAKPGDAKPGDAKPADTKPADTKAPDAKAPAPKKAPDQPAQ